MNLKRFFDFEVINETVIKPMDFTGVFDDIIKNIDDINTTEDLNKYIGNDVIVFLDYDTFFSTLNTENEIKSAPPKDADTKFGIQFALFNSSTNKINIVILPKFFKNFKYKINQPYISKFLLELIRHESVHLQQMDRSPKSYSLERSPVKDPKEYFSHHTEQMAYALSFVDNMKEMGYSKEKMLDMVRNKKDTNIWIQKVYNQMLDEKQYKKFMRYVYEYINEIDD